MAIERRTLKDGTVVGFNTERNSYCNLPQEMIDDPKIEVHEDENANDDNLNMNFGQMKAYAKENGLSVGFSPTKEELIIAIQDFRAKQGE